MRVEIEQGPQNVTTYLWGDAAISDPDGVEVYVYGTLRFTVSFRDGVTVVALEGEEGPLEWITTYEEDEE